VSAASTETVGAGRVGAFGPDPADDLAVAVGLHGLERELVARPAGNRHRQAEVAERARRDLAVAAVAGPGDRRHLSLAAAKDVVAILRSEAQPQLARPRALGSLSGLATRSEEFRGLSAAHNVRLHTRGVKRCNHPVVGELGLSYNRLELTADPSLMLVACTAEPGSRSAETFELLASWAATEEAAAPPGAIPATLAGTGAE
jgi:hypothetical protein